MSRPVRVTLADIADYGCLLAATHRAARGKRQRPEVRRFLDGPFHSCQWPSSIDRLALKAAGRRRWSVHQDCRRSDSPSSATVAEPRLCDTLAGNLNRLRADLLAGRAPYGQARTFVIHDPKRRVIQAPCFADRVCHHALIHHIGPILDRCLVDGVYACRVNKGALRAAHAVCRGLQRWPWFVRFDIRAYFASISHAPLLKYLWKRLKGAGLKPELSDSWRRNRTTCWAATSRKNARRTCQYASCATPVAFPNTFRSNILRDFIHPNRSFQVKRHIERVLQQHTTAPGKGLPIGALTSQHFADFFLSAFDRWFVPTFKLRGYVRYMDDVIVFCHDARQARIALRAARAWLATNLNLEVKHGGTVGRSAQGVTFCGYRVRRNGLGLSRRRRRRYTRARRLLARLLVSVVVDVLGAQKRFAAVSSILAGADDQPWLQHQSFGDRGLLV